MKTEDTMGKVLLTKEDLDRASDEHQRALWNHVRTVLGAPDDGPLVVERSDKMYGANYRFDVRAINLHRGVSVYISGRAILKVGNYGNSSRGCYLDQVTLSDRSVR